jgi:hypothetical protein
VVAAVEVARLRSPHRPVVCSTRRTWGATARKVKPHLGGARGSRRGRNVNVVEKPGTVTAKGACGRLLRHPWVNAAGADAVVGSVRS